MFRKVLGTSILGTAAVGTYTFYKEPIHNYFDLNHINIDKEINIKTFAKFNTALKKVDKAKTLAIVIETEGGDLSAAEAIATAILNSNVKTRCIVPNYALSAGTIIALSCDEIILEESAILSPCDGQMEFEDEVKSVHEIPNEEAKRTVLQQRKFVEKLGSKKKYSDEVVEKLYEEMFSGKYNHERSFTKEDLKEMGI